jgi:hypothetical protein
VPDNAAQKKVDISIQLHYNVYILKQRRKKMAFTIDDLPKLHENLASDYFRRRTIGRHKLTREQIRAVEISAEEQYGDWPEDQGFGSSDTYHALNNIHSDVEHLFSEEELIK